MMMVVVVVVVVSCCPGGKAETIAGLAGKEVFSPLTTTTQ